jgi:hypothetical protein
MPAGRSRFSGTGGAPQDVAISNTTSQMGGNGHGGRLFMT